MTEKLPQLKTANELERIEKLEKLKAAPNGFIFEERDGKRYVSFLGVREEIAGEYEDHIVEFETQVTREEDMQRIIADVKPSPVMRKVWTFLIDAYNQHEIPLIQSLPGTGKTYAFHRFGQLLYGDGSKAIKEDLLCTPKTSELEILGKWVPNGEHGVGVEVIRQKLAESTEWVEFTRGFELRFAALYNKKDTYSEDEFNEQRADLDKEYQSRQLELLMAVFPDSAKGQWRFEEGALIRAYQNPDDPNDEGGILLVDEIDSIPENYQNIFLQISGEGGKLASKISTYSGSDRRMYERGSKTFIGFAANYPEFAPGSKRSISPPLADRVTWLSITPEEARADEQLRIEKYGFRELAELIHEANPNEAENVRMLCARTLAAFHIGWKQNFQAYNKIDGIGGSELGRDQSKEFSQRTTSRVERFVADNLKNPEFINSKTGKPDLVKLVSYAIRVQYMKYLASEGAKRKVENELLLKLLYGGRKYLEKKGDKSILSEDASLKEAAFTYVDDAGAIRPYDSKLDKGKKILAFDEAADLVVKKAFRTKSERKKSLEAKKKEILDFDIDAALGKKGKK